MSETNQAPQPQEVNPSLKKAMPENALQNVVGAAERQFFLDRLKNSERGGMVGAVEDALRMIGNEVGLGQDSKELRALKKFLKEKNAKDNFNAVVEKKLTGKTQEEKADYMSSGMDNLKQVILDLMEVRKQAPEFSLGVVTEATQELWEKFLNGSEADRKAIGELISQMKKARKETWDAMMTMWEIKADLDDAHDVAMLASFGDDRPESEQYWSKPEDGLIRRLVAGIKKIPRGFKRAKALVKGAEKAGTIRATEKLSYLRNRALSLGGEEEDVQMWLKGIISREELGVVDLSADKLREMGLNDEQLNTLIDNKNLAQFQAPDGKFNRVSPKVQSDFISEFFTKRSVKAEKTFNESRERYLGFDIKNATNWQKMLVAAGVPADIILPEWLESSVAKLAVTGVDGVINFGEGVAEGVGFTIDHMESAIAGEALDNLSSSVVARDMAAEKLQALLKDNADVSEADLVKAAAVLRGAETAYARSALFAARSGDTVSMAEGRGLVASAFIAIPEALAAGLDKITGGVLAGEKTQKVFAEIYSRTKKLLDGNGVYGEVIKDFPKEGQQKTELMKKGLDLESEWTDRTIKSLKIPSEYYQDKSMMDFVNNKLLGGKAIELFRKLVGPEFLNWLGSFDAISGIKDVPFLQLITGGSKRQSVEQVQRNTMDRRSLNTALIEFVKEKLATLNPEFSTDLLVQEASLITRRDAQRENTKVDFKQIANRAKFDRMWSNLIKTGAGALGVAVASLAVHGLDSVAAQWLDHAGASLNTAARELNTMNEGLQKVIEIAQEHNLPTSETGARWDIFWQKTEVLLKYVNVNAAEFTKERAPMAKLLSIALVAASPILASLPLVGGAWPGRVSSDFMRTEQVK